VKTLKQYMEEYRQKIGKKTEEFKETTANVNKKSLVIENNPQSQK
jgi:thermostable 8-oxoguanine DNA glycosylase